MLAYTLNYKNHTSLVIWHEGSKETVEIHSPNRLEIAIAVLNNYPMRLALYECNPVVRVYAGKDEGELFETLKRLQELVALIKRDSDFHDFLNNPTLERLKAFIAIKKLIEDRRK